MLGTVINVITVAAGSTIGMVIKKSLPQRIVKTVFDALGVFTVFLGLYMALDLKGDFILVVVLSLVLGAILGEVLLIEQKLNLWLNRFNKGEKAEKSFSEGLITAFLLFCVGSMTLLGTFEEGISGKKDLILTKATMDFFSSIALATAFGRSILFSVIPLFIFQAGLTLGASYISPYFSSDLQNVVFSTGGIVMIGLGFNILNTSKIRVLNLMPALLISPIIYYVYKLIVNLSF